MTDQPSLFDPEPSVLPEGFRYQPDCLDASEERTLAAAIAALPLTPFAFHGFEGKRRVASFGWGYDFAQARLRRAEPIPDFLVSARERAARFAGIEAEALEQLLVTEYEAGAPIGWHKDRPVYGEVIGVSLLAPSAFRFRRRSGATWTRASLRLAPRSVYLLRGAARTEWEHSIPAVESLRYSLTFRTLKRKPER